MIVAQREIREAQALRGHRFRRIRDLPPLFLALLAEGLERSITLAESMDARGFGGHPSGESASQAAKTELLLKGVIALALVVLSVGAFAISYYPSQIPGGVAMLIGGGMLIASLGMVGRNVRRSRYRRERWERQDLLVGGASLILILLVAGLWIFHRSALIFYPYPRFAWPTFNPIIGLSLLLIAAPAVAGRLTGEMAYD
jgi:energy-coupling factor transport system permease protein